MKFEDRWCRAKLGCGVKNFVWDGMLAAHVLDNRPDITSLKFQAFVRLGVGDYNSHIEPFLRSKDKGGNEPNRIREAKLDDVLMYCGIDSLLEFKVARLQMKEMGYGRQSEKSAVR
jgi:hypothetical protein